MFEPRRIALVGASDRPGKVGELLWRNLAAFPGEVVPVTAAAETVAGLAAYPRLTAVPGDVDLAVVVVPAGAVAAVVRDAAVKRVPAVVVISAGFAETGPEGLRLQDEVMAAARAGGVRVVGPNCFGIQDCDLPLNASLAMGPPAGGGGISLVTQSGAYGMAIHALAVDEGVGFAKVCATGNQADVGDAEVLAYLGEDAASRTLCFFLESLPQGRAFFDAACRITSRKPVIVAKTGRSPAGIRAAYSHTAGLAGDERVWRAALGRAGVLLARSGLEMMDAARALDAQPPPAGARVAIVTNSGGIGVELADLLADEGLDVPELSAALQAELRARLPALASPRNPVDITPVWARFAELYPAVIELLARSGEVDSVVPVLLHRSAADEGVAAGLRDAVGRLRRAGVPVPVYVCWVAARASRNNADLLERAGVPCFEWPERTARAVGHATRYGAARDRVRPPLPIPARPADPPPVEPGWLATDAAARMLAAAGIPTLPSRTCASVAEAENAAAHLGYPVVAKVQHPSLLHKSDAGGVRVGLSDPSAVRAAAAELLALAPGARVLVQPRAAGTELLIGGIRDRQFGPFVLVGLGGVLADAIDDVALSPAPLDPDDARRLLDGLRGREVLAGRHGFDQIDLDALCRVICGVGDLVAAEPEIAELDLNPVFACSAGSVAADWRIRIAKPPSQDSRPPSISPSCTQENIQGADVAFQPN
ncbi:MAG TPA: acetate--CoA ligase family protein [Jatrophihabitans sp.]|nr:acetate--CoA ligase family protein [Jatrophihabitans sp.]